MTDSWNDSVRVLGDTLRSIACFGERTQFHAKRVRHLVRAIGQADDEDDGVFYDRVKALSAMAEEEICHAIDTGAAIELQANCTLIDHVEPMLANLGSAAE